MEGEKGREKKKEEGSWKVGGEEEAGVVDAILPCKGIG